MMLLFPLAIFIHTLTVFLTSFIGVVNSFSATHVLDSYTIMDNKVSFYTVYCAWQDSVHNIDNSVAQMQTL